MFTIYHFHSIFYCYYILFTTEIIYMNNYFNPYANPIEGDRVPELEEPSWKKIINSNSISEMSIQISMKFGTPIFIFIYIDWWSRKLVWLEIGPNFHSYI